MNVTTYVATANYHKLPLADPRPTVGASVQRSQPSVGQYVLRPLLNHDARCSGIDNPGCVKWRETLPSQEESAGRDIPMGQLVTKVLVSRESPLPPCQRWPGINSPVPRR